MGRFLRNLITDELLGELRSVAQCVAHGNNFLILVEEYGINVTKRQFDSQGTLPKLSKIFGITITERCTHA